MKQTGKRITEDELPRIEVLSCLPANGNIAIRFLEEFISAEDKVLLSQRDAHAMAVQEMEHVIAKEGYDPEFLPDIDSIELEGARQKVRDAEPDVDPIVLARLRKFYEFLCCEQNRSTGRVNSDAKSCKRRPALASTATSGKQKDRGESQVAITPVKTVETENTLETHDRLSKKAKKKLKKEKRKSQSVATDKSSEKKKKKKSNDDHA